MFIVFQDPDIDTDIECRLRDVVGDAERISQQQGIDTSDVHVEIRLYDGVINEKKPGKIYGAGIIDDNKFVLAVDPNEIDNTEIIDTLTSLGVHEINHLERMRLLGADPETLSEVLVSEGFAQVAESQANYKPAALSTGQPINMPSFERKVEGSLGDKILGDDRTDKDFDYWFDPDPGTHGIAYAGYELGFNIVSGYLGDTGKTLEGALKVPAEEIIQHWKDKKDGLTL